MPRVVVVDAGASSIQGVARYGSQRFGVSPGGAMDMLALAEANALVGRASGAAAIEIGPLPFHVEVKSGCCRFALSGADRAVAVSGRRARIRTSILANAGQSIQVNGARSGRFSYLAFQAGLDGASLDGPFPLRADRRDPRSWNLRQGDELTVGDASIGQSEGTLTMQKRTNVPIRVVVGPHHEYFSKEAIAQFFATSWKISHAADRMAYRLDGPPVPLTRGHNVISDGNVTGNIQIAGNGQPLVILCDRGTTGGYPKIATIIRADIGRFAQTMCGDWVNFEPVSVLEAQCAARDYAMALSNVKPRVEIIQTTAISATALAECNVAGEAFNAFDYFDSLAPSERHP